MVWGWLPSRGQCKEIHSFLVLTENPGKAKVAEFDDLLSGDEDVFGFDVSMDALKKKGGKMESSHRKHQLLQIYTTLKQGDGVFWTRPPC